MKSGTAEKCPISQNYG